MHCPPLIRARQVRSTKAQGIGNKARSVTEDRARARVSLPRRLA
jgi:hypothetical protein